MADHNQGPWGPRPEPRNPLPQKGPHGGQQGGPQKGPPLASRVRSGWVKPFMALGLAGLTGGLIHKHYFTEQPMPAARTSADSAVPFAGETAVPVKSAPAVQEPLLSQADQQRRARLQECVQGIMGLTGLDVGAVAFSPQDGTADFVLVSGDGDWSTLVKYNDALGDDGDGMERRKRDALSPNDKAFYNALTEVCVPYAYDADQRRAKAAYHMRGIKFSAKRFMQGS